jgi:hypothetical protein
LGFLAVLADALKAAAVGAPLVPGLRMDSLLPAAMRLRFAAMFAIQTRLGHYFLTFLVGFFMPGGIILPGFFAPFLGMVLSP